MHVNIYIYIYVYIHVYVSLCAKKLCFEYVELRVVFGMVQMRNRVCKQQVCELRADDTPQLGANLIVAHRPRRNAMRNDTLAS